MLSVPLFVYMFFPYLMFVISYVFAYFLVKCCYSGVVRVCASNVVSIVDFCEDLWRVGLFLLPMFPLGRNCSSAWILESVMNFVS